MNHYERLKVSPEAPPEVIRAAYRALAAKMHPDRKVGDSGPGDRLHEDMAALNASYLILMDAKARTDYDQMLAEQTRQAAKPEPSAGHRWVRPRHRTEAPADPAAAPQAAFGADTQINVDWMSTHPNMPMPWYRQPGPMAGFLVGASLLLGGLIWWGMQQVEHWQLDRGRLDAVSTTPGERGLVEATGRAAAQAASSRPSVPALTKEQLAHMSNEEFLAAMPQLIEGKGSRAASQDDAPPLNPGVDPQAVGVAAAGPHILDGQPLKLKLVPLKLGKHD